MASSGGLRESDNACAACSRDSGDHTLVQLARVILVHGNPECQVKTTVYCNVHAA